MRIVIQIQKVLILIFDGTPIAIDGTFGARARQRGSKQGTVMENKTLF